MASTKFYLDKRSNANVSPLKLSVRIGKNAILLSLGVKLAPSQWDEKAQKIINHPGKLYLNAFITSRKQEIDMALLELMKGGRIRNMAFAEIKNRIQAGANGGDCRLPETENNKDLFAARFKAYKESRDRKKGTYSVYRATYNKLRAYAGEEPHGGHDGILAVRQRHREGPVEWELPHRSYLPADEMRPHVLREALGPLRLLPHMACAADD